MASASAQRTYSAGSELSDVGYMTGTDRFDGTEDYGAVAQEDLTVRTPGTTPATPVRASANGAGEAQDLSARQRFDESVGDGLRTPELKAVAPARRRAARFLVAQGRRAVAFLDLAERVAVVQAYSDAEMAKEKAARRQASLNVSLGEGGVRKRG